MNWMEVSIHTTQEAVEPVSNILHEFGASGVVIEDSHDLEKDWQGAEDEIFDLSSDDYPEEGVYVKAYFPVNSFADETLTDIKHSINELLEHHIDLGNNEVTIVEVREEDWAEAWKKYYKPVKITDSLTIAPTWEEYFPAKAGEHVIELDPGMAFGTGTHPSTKLCLEALEQVLIGGEKVLDVGTGSGVLSIAAAKYGASQVRALDYDETAVEAARYNVRYNKTDELIRVQQNDLLKGIEGKADVVVANILAEIILRMVEDAHRLLTPGGHFITSGIIAAKKNEVKDSILSQGFTIKQTLMIDDWVAYIAQKQ